VERVSVVVVCDRCGEDTDLSAGSGLMLQFGSLASEVDLCQDCHKFLLGELEGVLDKGRAGDSLIGQRARQERKDRARVMCPDCRKYFHEGSGMSLHRLRKHSEGAEVGDGDEGNGNAAGTG
jgi:hypothetical protein